MNPEDMVRKRQEQRASTKTSVQDQYLDSYFQEAVEAQNALVASVPKVLELANRSGWDRGQLLKVPESRRFRRSPKYVERAAILLGWRSVGKLGDSALDSSEPIFLVSDGSVRWGPSSTSPSAEPAIHRPLSDEDLCCFQLRRDEMLRPTGERGISLQPKVNGHQLYLNIDGRFWATKSRLTNARADAERLLR